MTEPQQNEVERVQDERDRALEAQDRFAFLARSSKILAESLDYEETLSTVAALALPHLGAWCIVDVVEDGELRRLAVIHPNEERQALARELYERYPPQADDVLGVKRVIDAGRPEVVHEVGVVHLRETARDEEHLELMRTLGIAGYMTVPLSARGRSLGAITFVTAEEDRRFGDTDLLLAEDLAHRCALTIDNARLYRDAERAQGDAERAQGNADQALRQRNQALAAVSHDLRTPIHTIQLQAAMLLDDELELAPEKRKQALRTIRLAGKGMARLLQNLLDTSRLDAGHALALAPEPTRVAEILEEACALFKPQADAGDIRLECPIPDPDLRIRADPDRLLQIVWNLLGNAIKFTPSGGRVEVRYEHGDDVGRFRIMDTGPGIREEERPRLFEPYWQAEASAPKGTGLGLPITKALIEAHGGTIDVHSRETGGCTFEFTLPTEG